MNEQQEKKVKRSTQQHKQCDQNNFLSGIPARRAVSIDISLMKAKHNEQKKM